MKDNLLLILKGFAIGIGKIIPGVSGAILAITLNVYEPALHAISYLKQNFYQNMKYLAMLGIGIVVAIILGSNMIIFLLEHYYLPTICLFIGMMISGTLPIYKEIKNTKIKDIVPALIVIVGIVFFSLFPLNGQLLKMNSSLFMLILFFISGVLDALCSIVPGISGTAVLMMVGTYDKILMTLGSIVKFSSFFTNLTIIVPFFLGILFGGYFISKIINYVFKKHRQKTYCCVFVFSLYSMYAMLSNIFVDNYTLGQILMSVCCFIFGYFITKRMNN